MSKKKNDSKFLKKYLEKAKYSEEEMMKMALKESLKESKKKKGEGNEKKEEVKKKKKQLLDAEAFSKNFSNLYDDEKTSDVLIKFENGNKIYSHVLLIINFIENNFISKQ
jgi:hypothetical protein